MFLQKRKGGINTKSSSIAQNVSDILVMGYSPNGLEDIIQNCDSVKLRLLWEILFDTGMEDVELLEERIYRYGSLTKEQDRLSREIFLGLVAILDALRQRAR